MVPEKVNSYLSPGFSAFLPKTEPVLADINASFSAGWNQPCAFGFSKVYTSCGSEPPSVSELGFNSLINPLLQFNSLFNLWSIPTHFWQYCRVANTEVSLACGAWLLTQCAWWGLGLGGQEHLSFPWRQGFRSVSAAEGQWTAGDPI